DPYRLVRAALALGMHYLDLADSADFVAGIAQFDAPARQRGVFVLAGVSSFPALTAAVVRSLSRDMVRIDRVVGGIAPSPYANVGFNVIPAIAGYAGKPVAKSHDVRHGYALIHALGFTLPPPGTLPLRSVP